MNYLIKKSQLNGSLTIPSSKSQTMRAILFASLAKGTSIIENCLPSQDTNAMISACQQFGALINTENNLCKIIGVDGKLNPISDVVNVNNSGIVLRFITALSAHLPTYTVITGDHSIRHQRPMHDLLSGLEQLGVKAESTCNNGFAPIIVKGPIQPGQTILQGLDSQPVSALLIATAFTKGSTTIKVSNPGEIPWVELTLNWLDRLGINYTKPHNNFNEYLIKGSASINGYNYQVPGDLSTLAFPVAAALITNSELTISNVDLDDPQGDKKIIEVFIKMGAKISYEKSKKRLIVEKSGKLQAIKIDINDFIDSLPILAVVACFAEGTTTLTNALVARSKECDRIHCMANELVKLGAKVTETQDSLIIEGGNQLHFGEINSYGDHRMAMALSVAGMGINDGCIVKNSECISKTYPQFASDFLKIGANLNAI